MFSPPPQTKLVRRSSLLSDTSSSPPPPDIPIYLDLEFVTPAAPTTTTTAPTTHAVQEDDEDAETDLELDFPLFSGPVPQRLTLRSPTPPPADEDLWDAAARVQRRPLSHYILFDSEERRAKLASVAVTGEEVRREARKGWPAVAARCEWRVIRIPAVDAPTERRKKPGKKRRVKIRIRKKEEMEKEERRRKSQVGREKWVGLSEEEKARLMEEERVRKNREKKLKKREREKRKKEAAKAVDGMGAGTAAENVAATAGESQAQL
jgi:hypothetical protein